MASQPSAAKSSKPSPLRETSSMPALEAPVASSTSQNNDNNNNCGDNRIDPQLLAESSALQTTAAGPLTPPEVHTQPLRPEPLKIKTKTTAVGAPVAQIPSLPISPPLTQPASAVSSPTAPAPVQPQNSSPDAARKTTVKKAASTGKDGLPKPVKGWHYIAVDEDGLPRPQSSTSNSDKATLPRERTRRPSAKVTASKEQTATLTKQRKDVERHKQIKDVIKSIANGTSSSQQQQQEPQEPQEQQSAAAELDCE